MRYITLAIILLSCFIPGMAYAQDASAPPSAADFQRVLDLLAAQQKQIEALRAEVKQLREGYTKSSPHAPAPQQNSKQELPPAAAPEELLANRETPVQLSSGWNGEHFFIRSADGGFAFEPVGYLQVDHRAYSGDTSATNTFLLRRARFGFQGQLHRWVQYRVQAELTDQKSTLLRDAFINMDFSPRAMFKVGQFKEPYGQEFVTSASDLDFVERSLAYNLAPGYSPGVQIWGAFKNGVLKYQIGAFNGKGPMLNNDSGTPETVFRLRLSPFKNIGNEWVKGLAVGGAATRGRSTNGTSFAGTMQSGSFTFFKPVTVNGTVARTNAEVTWVRGPLGASAEYDQAYQNRDGLANNGLNLPRLNAYTGYAQLTYVLTGEKHPESGPPDPKHPFLGSQGVGAGAWELKFRYSAMRIGDTLQSARVDQFSTGFNWYMTSFVSYLFDVNVERLRTPISAPVPLRPQNFITVLSRTQFRF